MRKRAPQILKLVCLALAALVLARLVGVARRVNPLARVSIPALPSLPKESAATRMETNHPPAPAKATMNGRTTESGRPKAEDRGRKPEAKTNSPASNAVAAASRSAAAPTNGPAGSGRKEISTNTTVAGRSGNSTNLQLRLSGTNRPVRAPNFGPALAALRAGANKLFGGPASGAKIMPASFQLPPGAFPMGGPMMGGMGGPPPPPLPPAVQARVERITDSEILGPVIHPLPMALLGIAGKYAFLRAPSGQTGLVEAGHTLGDIKLLRIGVNRVLIEQDGQEKELTIFGGLGGESLLPKHKEASNETSKK